MTDRLAAFALLLGNLVIGLSILGPAGMIDPLAANLGVSVGQAAFLITGGAVVLCIGSPLVVWATAATDRRLLLSSALAILAICHVVSALAPDYSIVFAIRLAAMAVAAVFTPQAASAVSMMVAEKDRPGAISFIFLGWSLSAAAGLPVVAWAAAELGWRSVHVGLAVLAGVSAAMVTLALPRGLKGAAMSVASWAGLFRDRLVVTLLGVTILSSAGQFVVITLFGPLLARVAGAGTGTIAACFAAFGIAGFVGNVAASRVVGTIGPYATSLTFFGLMLAGTLVWTVGSGDVVTMGLGAAIWGLGFAASNSMQQARLAGAAPPLAGGAIALNSSSIYVGQAGGSATGSVLFESGHYVVMGWVTVALLAATLAIVATTRPVSRRA